LVFQVHLGAKATVFLVAIIIQFLYVFHDSIWEAYSVGLSFSPMVNVL
jgi:hypothetical protein